MAFNKHQDIFKKTFPDFRNHVRLSLLFQNLKVVGKMVRLQLQKAWNETDYLDFLSIGQNYISCCGSVVKDTEFISWKADSPL